MIEFRHISIFILRKALFGRKTIEPAKYLLKILADDVKNLKLLPYGRHHSKPRYPRILD